jgi:hypothetical protein
MNNKPTYDIASLPDLPDGWKYEAHCTEPDVLHVEWVGHGAVSINFGNRSIETGWCIPYCNMKNKKNVSGRGWQAKLVNVAVEQLREAWGE